MVDCEQNWHNCGGVSIADSVQVNFSLVRLSFRYISLNIKPSG